MATVTFIKYARQSAGAMNGVTAYVAQTGKTIDGQLVSGQNCNPQLAFREFLATRRMHHKDGTVWFYHYVQSFAKDEPVTGEQAHEVAKELAARAWPKSEVLIATHIDREHIHSHFIVNSVCYESGQMLRQGPRTLETLRPISDEICMAHHLSVLPNQEQKRAKGMSARDYRTAVKGESWKFRLMNTIDDCMKYARTKDDFIALMKSESYGVRWEDTRQSITYTIPSGYKCRDDRLHDERYLKEAMEHEFRIRAEIIQRGIERIKPAGAFIGETDFGTAGIVGTSDRGGVVGAGDDGQRTLPHNSGAVRPDSELVQSCGHKSNMDADIGDAGRIEEASVAARTGWEKERAALFAPPAPTASAAPVPGVAAHPADLAGALGCMVELGHALERDQFNPPIKDATTVPQYHERGKKRKLAPGQKADDHEDEQTFQQSMY